MFTYKNNGFVVPIKAWMDREKYFSDKAMVGQMENLARLPFAFRHIALSPDGHTGYGMPIGGILVTMGYVVPNSVGLDIGCGMCAARTGLFGISVEQLKSILSLIRNTVPVGQNWNEAPCDILKLPPSSRSHIFPSVANDYPVVRENFDSARLQLATLGSGNHFIEIQRDTKSGEYWVMVHSGSRNLGKKVAEHYNDIARGLNKRFFSSVPPEWDLAFLPMESPEGKSYLREMNYCVEFALANRTEIMERILGAFRKVVSHSVKFGGGINIAHNYARMENHFGQNVMVHRKGATSAKLGEIGIIPGSQGDFSYIVVGKGNPDSFLSCSHGAGRAMGRGEAIRTLDLEKERSRLDSRGILHTIRGVEDLDEATGAYKPIDGVMAQQADLVDISVKLETVACIKGKARRFKKGAADGKE